MVRQWQNYFYEGRYSQTDLEGFGPDFVKLAAAYDVRAVRAHDETSFLSALKTSLAETAAGRPALIEAIIDKDERVLPIKVQLSIAHRQTPMV